MWIFIAAVTALVAVVIAATFAFRDRKAAIVAEIQALRKENTELEFGLSQLEEFQDIEITTSVSELARALLEPGKNERQKELVSLIYSDDAWRYFEEDKKWIDFEGRNRSGILRDQNDTAEAHARSDAIYAIAQLLTPPDSGVSTNGDAYSYLLTHFLEMPTPKKFEFPSSRYLEVIAGITDLLKNPKHAAWSEARTVKVKARVPDSSSRHKSIQNKIDSNRHRIGALAEELAAAD